jgi:hypothetical protein
VSSVVKTAALPLVKLGKDAAATAAAATGRQV